MFSEPPNALKSQAEQTSPAGSLSPSVRRNSALERLVERRAGRADERQGRAPCARRGATAKPPLTLSAPPGRGWPSASGRAPTVSGLAPYERRRTPGPPAFTSPASRKTTPTASRARCTASTFAAVLRPGPRGPSIRRMVGIERPAASANSGWLQSTNARAALI